MMRILGWVVVLACAVGCGQNSDEEGNETDDGLGHSCPDGLPMVDDACAEKYTTCTYMNCGDYGVATATCRDDLRWDVETRVCEEVYCQQETCAPGFICVMTVAGFPNGSCVENTCGEGPIGCECPGCGELPCSTNGLTIECNACTSDVCP